MCLNVYTDVYYIIRYITSIQNTTVAAAYNTVVFRRIKLLCSLYTYNMKLKCKQTTDIILILD